MDDNWLSRFRDAILAYNQNRASDPFMIWFRQKERLGFFEDDTEKVLTILIDARFDQMTTAEKALANTKTVVKAGCLKGTASPVEFPVLIPRQFMTPEKWTALFVRALPRLRAISSRIVAQKTWKADELCDLMLNEIRTPYLGVKTTRLAVRWLYELLPSLEINMNSYEIPIDRLVYRVSCRLGLLDPNIDKYSGQGSDADVKLQTLVKRLLPRKQWLFDEPLWSTGRKPVNGGHCFPINPHCSGCIFEKICRRMYLDFDPAQVGMELGSEVVTKANSSHNSCRKSKLGITPRQAEFAKFVEELKQRGVRGQEWREEISRWRKEHP